MKKILSLVLTLSMLVSMCVFTGVSVSAQGEQWNGEAAANFSGGGDGSPDNPYKIGTAGELKLFANIVNGEGGQTKDTDICGILTADIVLNSGTFTVDENNAPLYNGSDATAATVNAWTPIGINYVYGGTFNGAGHTVSGLYFNDSNQNFVGLFGTLSSAEISDLGVVNSFIQGNIRVGGVCGENISGTITDCYNSGTVIGSSNTGGVCGFISDGDGTLTGCYNTGTVMGGGTAGGVCGSNTNGTITGCYNTGAVSGTDNGSEFGGVCGSNTNGTITDCYNTGTVIGSSFVGGVCGSNSDGTITDCYNTGAVGGTGFGIGFGGVCGCSNYGAIITGCYNTGTVSGTDSVNGLGGVCGNVYGSMDSELSKIIGCYNAGTISCGNGIGVGGVCGSKMYAEIANCYYLDTCADRGTEFDSTDGTSKTENEMKSQEFVDLLNANGGDFALGKNGYPVQAWQIPPEPEYTVTIPAEISLGQTVPVSVDVTTLTAGKQVVVTLTGTSGAANAFTMTTADGAVITYTVSNGGNPAFVGDKILTANAVGNKSASLVFNAPETVQFAGTYTGTISFTVSVADAN